MPVSHQLPRIETIQTYFLSTVSCKHLQLYLFTYSSMYYSTHLFRSEIAPLDSGTSIG
jgi:hypothetical protein